MFIQGLILEPKSPKAPTLIKRAHFKISQKKRVVFDAEFKTGRRFEIKQRQQT